MPLSRACTPARILIKRGLASPVVLRQRRRPRPRRHQGRHQSAPRPASESSAYAAQLENAFQNVVLVCHGRSVRHWSNPLRSSTCTPTFWIARARHPSNGMLAEIDLHDLGHPLAARRGLSVPGHGGAGKNQLRPWPAPTDHDQVRVEQVATWLAAACRCGGARQRSHAEAPHRRDSARSSRSRMCCIPGSSRNNPSKAGPPRERVKAPAASAAQIGPYRRSSRGRSGRPCR